jgi:hypothetical protein
MLMSDELTYGTLCTTDTVSAVIEQVQYTLGEGPCIDHRYARPVLEPELSDRGQARWLGFTTPVVEAGAQAVFAFPLRVGAIRIGVLDLYRDRPGLLTDDQHADSLVLANVAAEMILLLQADASAGTVGAELDPGRTSTRSCTRPRAWSRPNSGSASAAPCCGCERAPSPRAGRRTAWPATSYPDGCASTTRSTAPDDPTTTPKPRP